MTNVPEYCVKEVATQTFALALVQATGTDAYNESVEAGTWAGSTTAPIPRFSTLTVDIIGSELGQYVSTRGADVLVHDTFLQSARVAEPDVKLGEFDALIEGSHIIPVHTPLTEVIAG